MSNYITIKLRRGTAAQWTATNPVLAEGEFGAETDTRKFKIGNGVTAWNSLQYWGGSGGGAADFTDLGDVPASYTGQGGKYVKVKSTADGLEFGTLTIAAADLPTGIDAAKIGNGTVSNTEFQTLNGAEQPFTTALKTKLDGIEAGADVTDSDNVGSVLNAATAKTTPVDADTIPLSDSAAAGGLKKLSWANLKATAKAYFDTIYAAIVHTHAVADIVNVGHEKLIGRHGAGTGAAQEVGIDGGLEFHGGNIRTSAITGDVTISAGGTTATISGLDAAKIADGTVSNTEFQYLNGVSSAIQTQLDGKVDENAAITPATKTKITYDAKGLVTAGADATTADIADSSNKRYVTDAQLTVIGNTSGTNTGDQTITLTGDVTGSGTGSFAATIANGAVTNAKVGTGIDAAKIADGTVSNAEFQTLDGVTSSIQTQLDGKANSSHTHSAADITSGTLDGDRLPGLSSTKRGGVPATGTPSGLFLKDDGTWATPATGGVSDGDKGDITVTSSGTVWTIDNDAVSYGKIQNVSAASKLLGRGSASGSGDVEELSIGTGLSLSGTTLSATGTGTAITLNRDFTQKGVTNSTTKTALYSYTLPTDLVAGDTLILHIGGQMLQHTSVNRDLTLAVELGATSVISGTITHASNAQVRNFQLQLVIAIGATNSQKMVCTSWSSTIANGTFQVINNANAMSISGYNTSSEDLTSAKTLQIAATLSTASTSYYIYSEHATLIKYPKP